MKWNALRSSQNNPEERESYSSSYVQALAKLVYVYICLYILCTCLTGGTYCLRPRMR